MEQNQAVEVATINSFNKELPDLSFDFQVTSLFEYFLALICTR